MTGTDLSPCSGRGDPEPDGVARDAEHGAGRHHVSHGVSPPGVFVVLVDQVLPGQQLQSTRLGYKSRTPLAHLEEEDARTDSRSDDRPAAHKEVAGVVANHVVEGQSEPPRAE